MCCNAMQQFSRGTACAHQSTAAVSSLASVALKLVGVERRVKETSAVNLSESVQAGGIWPTIKVLWHWGRRKLMAGCLSIPRHAQASTRRPVPGTRTRPILLNMVRRQLHHCQAAVVLLVLQQVSLRAPKHLKAWHWFRCRVSPCLGTSKIGVSDAASLPLIVEPAPSLTDSEVLIDVATMLNARLVPLQDTCG